MAKIKAKKEDRIKGKSALREYWIWVSMVSRCEDKTNKHYGGRGIEVCDSWKIFENFYRDMGPRPSEDHSIDRRNSNKGYNKANCRWATPQEQHSNTSYNKIIEIWGTRKCLAEWCRFFDLDYGRVNQRINYYRDSVAEALGVDGAKLVTKK